jgi:hypothetical protein
VTAGTTVHPPTAPADIVSLSEDDLPEIASFIAVQSGRSSNSVEAHLRWFWLQNPARESQAPSGFGLRSGHRIVGCILCSPQTFHFGDQTINLAGSSSFYVDEQFRGQGGRMFLSYARLAGKWPLFGTSANAEAAALWKAVNANPLPQTDGELFGVLRWPPVAEEFAHRKFSNRLLTRFAGSALSSSAAGLHPLKIDVHRSGSLSQLTSAEQAVELSIHDSPPKLTAMRDLPYIRWRYFSGRDSTAVAFAFRSRSPDQDVLVTVNQRVRGYRQQITTLNLLDVYPEVSTLDCFRIVEALAQRYYKLVDTIVLRNQTSEQRQLFRARGFLWRSFDAPTGWFLDKAKLLPTPHWYGVPADGDGLI